jgi:hypothetical protein
MRAWRQYRQILGIADARALIGAGAASEIGNWLYNAALLAFVFERTHSAGCCRWWSVRTGPWWR